MIIDAHVHYTPPILKEELYTIGEPYLEMLLGGKGSIQDWVSAETMLSDMDAAGIDRVVLVGEYFQRHENCVIRNNRVLDIINKYPERISAYAIVQPNAGDAALTELRRCLDSGMSGLGEINPYAQNFNLADPGFIRIANECASRNVPINLHVGEPIGRYYTGKSTTPLDDYYQLAVNCPETKLVFAHWGGGVMFYEMMPHVRKQMANVYYDTAASPLLYPTKRIFKTALNCVAPHKLLYGSDYPLRIYPGKMASADFQPFLSAINKQDLDATFKEAFFAGNYLQMESSKIASSVDSVNGGEGNSAENTPINWRTLPIRRLTQTCPQTIDLFAKYNIPTTTDNAPSWEPVDQATRAKNLTDTQRQDLLNALTEIITSQ